MATETIRRVSGKILGHLRLVIGRNIPHSGERKSAIELSEKILSKWAHRLPNEGFGTMSELLVLEGHLEAIFGVPIDGDDLPETLRLLKSGEPMKNIVDWLRRFPEDA